MVHADFVPYNARVRTLDPARPLAEGLAAYQGRVVLVGSNGAVLAAANPETVRPDGRGRPALPGFGDAHIR